MDVKRLKFIDRTFVIVLLLLVVFGLVVLRSATSAISADHFTYVKRQLVAIFIGLSLAVMIIRFDFVQLRRYGNLMYGFSILLLIMVLVFGQDIRGTTGWIQLGPLPAFQPAEITKILLILSFADFLTKRNGSLDTFKQMVPCFVFMGVPLILIMLQPDLGTGLVYIAVTIVMMYFAGANGKILGGLFAGGVACVALVLFLHFQYHLPIPLKDYQLDRLTVFLNPYNDGQGGKGPGWNTIQSLIAIGSGGLAGKGLFHGTQVQLNFLPEHHTDFIYAVIGEEMGFLGAVLIIVLYGILLVRAIVISFESKELFGTLLVVGISAMWLFHIFENIGMSLGMMPITGIPLPFLSFGGTSMVSNLAAAGLIISVNLRSAEIVF